MRRLAILRRRLGALFRRGEAGYNLVILMVAVTVLNILVAAALPLWSTQIKREKEAELVFRGLQYAEAIRIFQTRFGRHPVRLEELIEVKPRSIRQLWKDPMVENGKWELIFAGPTQDPNVPPQGQGGQAPPPPPQGQDPNQQLPGDSMSPDLNAGEGETVTIGPIIGVRSRSTEESLMTWNGRQRYDQWHFRADMLLMAANRAGFGEQTGPPSLSSRWIGRPLRRGFAGGGQGLPPPGGLGGQPPPGGLGGQPPPGGPGGPAGGPPPSAPPPDPQ